MMIVDLFLVHQATQRNPYFLNPIHSWHLALLVRSLPARLPPLLGTIRWKCRGEYQYPEHICVWWQWERRDRKGNREGVSYSGNFPFNSE